MFRSLRPLRSSPARNPGLCVLGIAALFERSRPMFARLWLAPVVFSASVLALPFTQAPAAKPAPPANQNPAPAQDPGQTTLDDQVDLAITVYNSDLALV